MALITSAPIVKDKYNYDAYYARIGLRAYSLRMIASPTEITDVQKEEFIYKRDQLLEVHSFSEETMNDLPRHDPAYLKFKRDTELLEIFWFELSEIARIRELNK